ncbi:14356_t:CDS:2, partial [Acaulospora colombiana]
VSDVGNSSAAPSLTRMSTYNIRKVTNDIYKRADRFDQDSVTIEWDCITREEEVRDEYAKARRKWADAAYRGDWDEIFKVSLSTALMNSPTIREGWPMRRDYFLKASSRTPQRDLQ